MYPLLFCLLQSVLAGYIHLTGTVSESSANLQICLSVVIMAHLHPEAHILPVDITGAMGALFCFCFFFFKFYFWLSPTSCSIANPVYQREILTTWASAAGEMIKPIWIVSKPTWLSTFCHPILYLDCSSLYPSPSLPYPPALITGLCLCTWPVNLTFGCWLWFLSEWFVLLLLISLFFCYFPDRSFFFFS